MKRAAVVTHGPLTVMGGAERHLGYLVEFLEEEGFTVDVVTPQDEQAPRIVRRYLYPLVQYYYTGREVSRHRQDYDLIVTISFTGGSLKGNNVINISYGSVRSYYRSIRRDADYNWKWHLGMYLTIWLDRLNKRDKLCLTISEQVKRELERDYGVKSISVPVGVDMEHFSNRILAKEARRSLGIDEQSTVGLFSGRWDVAHKGLDVLMTIIRERRDIHWLLCTDRDLAIDGVKNLTVLRKVAYAEMPKVYCAADFSIQLSRYESFGLSFLESVACGVPVISTPVGITNEVYSDPPLSELMVANPLASPEKTVQEVNRVIQALKNREYRNGIATRGRAVVEKEFSLEMWKARMRNVLQKVLGERQCG